MSDKEKYKELIKQESVPIFYSPQWLDIVSSGSWDVRILESNNRLRAIWVFQIRSKLGIPYCLNFQYTPYTGFLFFHAKDSQKTELLEKRYVRELTKDLSISYTMQNQYPSVTSAYPYIMNGYSVQQKFTYRIDLHTDYATKYNPKLTQHIAIAKNKYVIKESQDIETLLSFHNQVYEHKNDKQPFDNNILRTLFAELGNRVFYILEAHRDNEIVGSILIAFDNQSAYYLAGGSDYTDQDIMSSLIAQSIQIAKIKGLQYFDFHGSSHPSVERFFRKFNADITPYFCLIKRNGLRGKLIDVRI